jgi:hypothetical protein
MGCIVRQFQRRDGRGDVGASLAVGSRGPGECQEGDLGPGEEADGEASGAEPPGGVDLGPRPSAEPILVEVTSFDGLDGRAEEGEPDLAAMGVAAEDEVDGVVGAAAPLCLVGRMGEYDGEVPGPRGWQEEQRLSFDVVIDPGDTEGGAAVLEEGVAVGEVVEVLPLAHGAPPVEDAGSVVMVAGDHPDAQGRLEGRQGVEDGVEARRVLGQVAGDGDEVGRLACDDCDGLSDEACGAALLEVDVGEEGEAQPFEGGREGPDVDAGAAELEPARLDEGGIGREGRGGGGACGGDPMDRLHAGWRGKGWAMRLTTGPARVTLPGMTNGRWVRAALAAAVLWVGGAEAQEPPERWSGDLGLSVNGSGGNESLTIITTDLGLTRLETDRYELSFRGRARYGQSEGEEVARNVRGSLNADFGPGQRWSPFLFATAEHDPFRRLDVRVNSGAGLKRTFWREGWSEVSVSGAVLHSFEDLAVPDTVGPGTTSTARWSWRGRARRQVREGTRFEQVVFFQPAWDRIGDYLLEAQSSGRLALSESLALTTGFLYQRDSTPPPEVSPDDWSISIGLSVATSW